MKVGKCGDIFGQITNDFDSNYSNWDKWLMRQYCNHFSSQQNSTLIASNIFTATLSHHPKKIALSPTATYIMIFHP